ncbi:MAG: ribosomal protein S18-alanine N-acetyltransferase [Magnetococcales bacterium]|nr:ribosomal protein S18-alanine N-acetyltransferase [Magnetococcales bacterium]
MLGLEWSVRSMVENDLGDVVALEKQCSIHPWRASAFREELSGQGRCLVAERRCTGKIIGYCIAQTVVDCVEIRILGVEQSARRQGVAWELLEQCALYCREIGMIILDLEVRADNQAALNLYQRFGFKEVGRRPGYYRRPPPAVDAVLMRLEI